MTELAQKESNTETHLLTPDAVEEFKQLDSGGFSRLTVTLGLLNIGVTAFFLGRFPQHYWLLSLAKAVFIYIPSWFWYRWKAKELWFVTDYCWVQMPAITVYLALSVLSLVPGEHRLTVFLWFFGAAAGPMACAVLILENALDHHSLKHLSCLFVHLTPNMIAWTMRWYAEDVNAAWPDRFPDASQLEGVPLLKVWMVPYIAYLGWWVAYTTWLLTCGVRVPELGCGDTLFSWNSRMLKVGDDDLTTFIQKASGVSSMRGQAFLYCLGHLFGASIFLAWPMACWQSYTVHSLFTLATFVSSCWQGADFQVKLFEKLKALIHSKAEPDERTE